MTSPRVALVTGAASGIGLATATRLLSDGYLVGVADRDGEAACRAVAELGHGSDQLVPLEADVADSAAIDAMVAAVVNAFGGLGLLVNNAGYINPGPTEEVADEDWDALMGVHLGGMFRCCRAAFPALKADGHGAVVSVASASGRIGQPGRASYAAAKAGMESLSRVLAVEWASHGIRVNAVAPGYVKTPNVERALTKGIVTEEGIVGRIPLGRLARADEIADAIAYLGSPQASYVTGHTLVVDGGFLIDGRF